MGPTLRRRTACLAAFSLILWLIPAPVLSSASGGRIEGLVLDADGRPAAAYEVVLVEPSGHAVATSVIAADGLYSFKDLAAGRYAMGIQRPDGAVAPVAAEPVSLEAGQLVRRDITLMEADAEQVSRAAAHYQVDVWWVSRTRGEKIWTVVGIIGGLGLLWYLLKDDRQITASEVIP